MKNSIIIKKIENEKFIMIDNEKEININYEIHEEKIKKDGEIIKINHWLLLPENSINRKGFRIEDFENIDEKEYFERKSPEFSDEKKSSKNWIEYLNEEEKKTLENLKNIANKRMREEEENEKRKRENPKYKELMRLKKVFDESIKSGLISENSEDYKRILREIEKF